MRVTSSPTVWRRGLVAPIGRVALWLAIVTTSAAAQRPTVEYLQPFGKPTRPFSPAVRVGNLVLLAGQIGTDAAANGGVVPGGIQAETRQTLENIKQVLTAIGLTMDDVVKCTVFMADMKEWDAMNAVYRTYFKPERLPARSALGANGLALNARVEIECMAAAQ
ncbi:MAG: RidA family protein [Gemmatimonadaceae bacterium]|nr:RidA family protein [Gemmatimonadaceae bacterium]